MKKRLLIAAALVWLTLTGCAAAAPQSGETVAPPSLAEQPVAEAPAPERSETPDSAPAPAATAASYDLEGLTAAVDSIEAKMAVAAPQGDREADYMHFQELHGELEAADRLVDAMEDTIEADVHSGALSREEYRALDDQLDALDDRLDRAEDLLEFAFGIDD